jgi:hypothetical protein
MDTSELRITNSNYELRIIGVSVKYFGLRGFGSEKFKDEVECNLLRRARPGAVGRPSQCDARQSM